MNYIALAKAISSTLVVMLGIVLFIYVAVNYALQAIAIIMCLLILGIFGVITLAFYEEYKK